LEAACQGRCYERRTNARAPYHRVMRTVFAGLALATMLLASVAAAAPGAKSERDAFPGRNGQIVFSGGHDYPDLYLMRADGTKLRRITRARGSEIFPKWSPDGKSIAYVSDRSRPRNEAAFEIYVMRANGTGLRRITRDRFVDYDLDWAPDGKNFVFVSTRPSATSGLWVMNVKGTGLRRLTGNGEAPAWSPDGTTIAFARYKSPLISMAIWLMNADGSNQRQLTVPPEDPGNERYGNHAMPAWSPDSKQIAFVQQYRDRTDIYVIRRDGTGIRRLTTKVGQHTSPAWSPNGKRIVFVTGRYQRREINVMNADGTQQKRLSAGVGGYVNPDWQPLPRR
jgi:TolB protein